MHLMLVDDSAVAATVASPTSDPVSESTAIYVRPYKPCPPDVDDECLNGVCEMIFKMNEWQGPVCRCEKMFFGRRCEFFRPPGMLTKQGTVLLVGGIFFLILVIVAIIVIYLGAKYCSSRQPRGRQGEPLLNNTHTSTEVTTASRANNVGSSFNDHLNNNNDKDVIGKPLENPNQEGSNNHVPSNPADGNSTNINLSFLDRKVSRYADETGSDTS